MTLQIYRIDTSVVGKVFRMIRKPSLHTTQSFAIGSNIARGIGDFVEGSNYYLIGKEELSRFINPLGNNWIEKEQYYIRHPKKK